MAGLSDGLLEPAVIHFDLHCHVSLPMYRKQKTSLSKHLISLQDYPYLKAGIAFSPHGSLEDMLPATRSSEITAIVRKEQYFLHTDITVEQLEETMLPKAIDYFRQNAEAMVYQMRKFKHGFALIQVEKPCMSAWRSSMRRRSTSGRARKRKLFQGHDEELIRRRIHGTCPKQHSWLAWWVQLLCKRSTVSRITSYLFSKCDHDERTASTGHHNERLEMAHTELELALERSARMPITDVSLLRRRKLLERAFKDCGDLLHRCIKQQTMDVIEFEQPVRHSSKWILHVTQSSVSSYFTWLRKDNISCSDVRRNEWFAECTNHFLRDVESGCSPLRGCTS
nr:uncharacterized protein LOC117833877 [Setaria viridis]